MVTPDVASGPVGDDTADGGPGPGDRYDLGEVLGRGGMAVVHRAHDRVLDRPVAIKVLRDTVDDTERQRFTSEARTLARLSHIGLVTVLDAGVSSERPFLVMELVDGPTLAEKLTDGPLPLSEVASVGTQLARALAYAHEVGVVHRDVKPANVLLGPDGRIKLADFGIARLLGETVRHTQTGTTIGTAAYLSPEQVQGHPVEAPSDVYSLALVLLETITGQREFPGSPTESALARLSRPPHLPDDLPPDLSALLRDMAATDPADRPSAAQVADRLDAWTTGTPAPATVDEAGRTSVLPTPPPGPAPVPHRDSAIDRAGDAMAGAAVDAWERIKQSSEHQRGAAAALAVLVILLVVAALVGANTSGSGDGSGDELPSRTPTELRAPLGDLHDAVNGGSE